MPDPVPSLPSRLVQLVARFRPDADGVGETALRLADALWQEHGIASDFLVFHPPRPERVLEVDSQSPHTVEQLNISTTAFDAALNRLTASSPHPPVLLIHYSSYGFSPNGTPFWLPRALNRFTRRGGHLLSFFHELYAIPRFPSKTIVTSWIQKRIYRQVLAASEAAFTSSDHYIEIMRRDDHARRPLNLIGICSSAGEPQQPGPLAQRTRRLVVFGRFSTRKELYQRHLPELEGIARRLDIGEIADIGAIEDEQWMREQVVARLGGLVRSYGALPVSTASQLMEDSLAGVLVYPYSLTGKSSVFAAYQAHAMAILLFTKDNDPQPPDVSWPLAAEELLTLPAESPALAERLQQAADAAHQHYQRYRSAHSMAQTLLPALAATLPSPSDRP